MSHDLITLAEPLDPATPPERLLLFKFGVNDTMKGKFLFDEAAALSVIEEYEKHGAELPFDFDHAMVAGDEPSSRIAAGWFKPEVIEGSLWATDIRWTPKALSGIKDREWRYLSPAFTTEAPGKEGNPRRIKRLINVALTNLPATVGMVPIAAHAGAEGDRDMTEPKAPDKGGDLVTLTGLADPEVARATVLGWKAKAERCDELEAEIKVIRAASDRATFDARVTEALSTGRLMPAKKDDVEKLFVDHGLAAASSALSLLSVPAKTSKVEPPKGSASAGELDEIDRGIMRKHGYSEAEMLSAKRTLDVLDGKAG